jgi:hypothetical protein
MNNWETIALAIGIPLLAFRWYLRVKHTRAGWQGYKENKSVHPRGRLHEFIGFDAATGAYKEIRNIEKADLLREGYKGTRDFVRLSIDTGTNDREARRWMHSVTQHSRWICPW